MLGPLMPDICPGLGMPLLCGTMSKMMLSRRVLRDKIGEHASHFSGTGLDLGEHDERDEA